MSFTTLYRDTVELLEANGIKGDEILDEILELEAKFNAANDKYQELLAEMRKVREISDQAI